jgi:NhaP-type Na+/H+ or K+/H+ antiporter
VSATTILPISAAPGFHFGDLYAVALLAAGLALLLAVVALSREGGRAFTSATVYLFMGALVSLGLSAVGVDLLDPLQDSLVIERAAELAVVIALFSAGIRLDRPLSLRGWASTARLIGLAMPLTIGLVALLGNLVMGLSWGAAIVLAAALAPTDPVLAGEVQVGPPGEGGEEEPRFALTSEAGLNDGLAFPFVFLGLLVAEPGDPSLTNWLLADVLYGIAVGTLVGALAGWGLAAATSALREREWLLAEYDGWLAIAGVLVAYGAAEVLGAYGFLAAFAGGLAFRRHEREHEYHQPVHRGIAELERVSELALVLLLGSTVTLVGLSEPGLGGLVLALALLFAIRPAAVLVSFLGSRLAPKERLFIGWFGVRGVGSFYYVAVAIGAGVLSAAESTAIYWTVIICVGLSIIVHGLTGTPASRGLGLKQDLD